MAPDGCTCAAEGKKGERECVCVRACVSELSGAKYEEERAEDAPDASVLELARGNDRFAILRGRHDVERGEDRHACEPHGRIGEVDACVTPDSRSEARLSGWAVQSRTWTDPAIRRRGGGDGSVSGMYEKGEKTVFNKVYWILTGVRSRRGTCVGRTAFLGR